MGTLSVVVYATEEEVLTGLAGSARFHYKDHQMLVQLNVLLQFQKKKKRKVKNILSVSQQ